MLHQFRTAEGDVEVTVAKQGDVWQLGQHQATVEDDGRLSIRLANGTKGYATLPKLVMYGGFISKAILSV